MVLYTPKDETDASTFTFVDSRNGKWFKVNDSQNYGGTSMQVWAVDTAVRVNFRGNAAILFGTVDQGINVTVSIDEGKPKTVFQSTNVKNYRQQLYNCSNLEYGDHTLLVTQLFDHFPLIVDYAMVDEGETSNSTNSSSGVSSVNSDATVADHHSSISPGGIAGIVIAIIVILGAIVFAVLWRRRMRRVEHALRPHPLPPTELPLHTRPHVPDTIAPPNVPEKAQLRALWQASQDRFVQTNREPSSSLDPPSSSANHVKPSSSPTSSKDHASSLPSDQKQTSSSRADVDTTSPSSDMNTSPISRQAPPTATDMTVMTGSSIPASGWSFHQRSVSFAQNVVPESPTASINSRGTFDSSDLDHAVPKRAEPEPPPYPGSLRGSDA